MNKEFMGNRDWRDYKNESDSKSFLDINYGHAAFGSISRFDVELYIPPEILVSSDMGCVGLSLIFVILRLQLRLRRKIANSEDILVFLAWIIFAIAMSLESAGSIIDVRAYTNIIAWRLENTGLEIPTGGVWYDADGNALYRPQIPFQDMYVNQEEIPFWEEIEFARKLNWGMQLLYHTPLYFVKFAWLRFYYILVPTILKKTRKWLDLTLLFCIVGYICTIVITATACSLGEVFPNVASTETTVYFPNGDGTYSTYKSIPSPDKGCSPFTKKDVVFPIFAFHAMSEISVYVLPLFVIFRLRNLSIGKRLSVAVLFVLGFFCLFLMVFNVWFTSSLVPRFNWSKNPVLTGIFWPLEPAWGIIVICMPASRATMVEIWSTLRKTKKGTSNSDTDITSQTASASAIVSGASDASTIADEEMAIESDGSKQRPDVEIEEGKDIGITNNKK